MRYTVLCEGCQRFPISCTSTPFLLPESEGRRVTLAGIKNLVPPTSPPTLPRDREIIEHYNYNLRQKKRKKKSNDSRDINSSPLRRNLGVNWRLRGGIEARPSLFNWVSWFTESSWWITWEWPLGKEWLIGPKTSGGPVRGMELWPGYHWLKADTAGKHYCKIPAWSSLLFNIHERV